MQPPQRMIARSLGMPYLANALDQAGEVQDIVFSESRFLCAQSKYHFRSAVEGSGLVGEPGSRKFQPVATESNLAGRQGCDFGFRHEGANLRDGIREPCFHG